MFVHVFACKYCINKNICEIGWIVWRTFFKADKVHTVTHRQKRFEMLNKHFKVKCTVNICTCTPLFYFSIYTVWSFYSYAIHFLLCLILYCKHCFWISFLVWYGCCADSEADWRLWRHNLQWAEQFFQHRVVWHSRATGGTFINLYGSLLLLRLFYDIIGLGTKCSHKYFIPCVLCTVYLKFNFATLYFQGSKIKRPTKIIHKCNKKMYDINYSVYSF